MIYGYARTSRKSQNIERQSGKVENAEKILHCFRKYSKGSNRLEQGYFLWRMEQHGEMVSDYL